MKRFKWDAPRVALLFLGVMIGLAIAGGATGLLLQAGVSRADKGLAFTAVQARTQTPPEPRLQVDPLADRQVVLGPERLASTWGWIDQAHTHARMPVDEAMRRLADRGWPQPEAGQ